MSTGLLSLFLISISIRMAMPQCVGDQHDCHNVGDQTVCYDPTCSTGNSLGCNAGGEGQNCRFCGFSVYPPCPDGGPNNGNSTNGGDEGDHGACASSGGRVCFRVENNCDFHIWPGLQGSTLVEQGGWHMAPHTWRNIFVPDRESAGRIWARTGCDNSYYCDTGFCQNSVYCDGKGGRPPATLAEFTLAAPNAGNNDFYDISLVDGYNLPISIEPLPGTFETNGGEYDCRLAGHCVQDLNLICPPELQYKNAGDQVVACDSACLKFDTDQYCCRGAYGTPQTCQSTDWPVNYPAIFKQACPTSYSYAYDDHTSTFMCRGKGGNPSAAYKISFC